MKIAKEDIQDTGLNVLYRPDQLHAATVDIVFVHGIQSHPRRAWEYESNRLVPKPQEALRSSSEGSKHGWLKHISFRRKKDGDKKTQDGEGQSSGTQTKEHQSQEVKNEDVNGRETEGQEIEGSGSTLSTPHLAATPSGLHTSISEGGSKYWPLDFLPDLCPSARIIAWGYDTQVTRGYTAATQHNIFSLAKDMLYGLGADRERNGIRGRPIIFVAHSLGGILVKEVLRRSKDDNEPEYKDILTSTAAVIFLGTPHRGSSAAQLADVVRTVASVMLRLDTNDKVLRALSGADSPELELGREAFIPLWEEYKFKVKTFQEIKPMTGVNISSLNKLVVPSWSSSLDNPKEHAETINADHVNMCKFKSLQDDGYKKVSTAIIKFVKGAASQYHSLDEQEKECLASLKFDTLESRQSQIPSAALNTCEWFYNLQEFRKWYEQAIGYENKMLWIKGKPGSGKSVLMKALNQRVQRERTSGGNGFIADAVCGTAVAAFFFKGRQQRYYETNPAGLYRTLLYQLFKQDPYLRQRLLSEYEGKRKYRESWRDDELKDLFVDIYLNENAEAPLKRAFIFVDAVDECREDLISRVVNLLSKLAEKKNFSVCLSSRHYPRICVPNCVEVIAENHNGRDIQHYIRSNLSRAFPDRESVVKTISNKAAGVFLWVEIVLELLNRKIDNGESTRTTLKTLDDIPSKIEDLYVKLLENLKPEDGAVAINIFRWVVLAAEPLTLADLRYALVFTGTKKFLDPNRPLEYQSLNYHSMLSSENTDVPDSLHEWKDSEGYIEGPDQFLIWLRGHSRGLVEVQSKGDNIAHTNLEAHVVQFIHETARTFFLTGDGFRVLNPAFQNDVQVFHNNLLSACLNFISIEELKPIEFGRPPLNLDLKAGVDRHPEHLHQIESPPQIQSWIRPSSSTFLEYAVTYLLYHYLEAEGYWLSSLDIVDILLANNGQIWRRWKGLSEKRALNFSWVRTARRYGDGGRLISIEKELNQRLNLDSTGVFLEYLDSRNWPI